MDLVLAVLLHYGSLSFCFLLLPEVGQPLSIDFFHFEIAKFLVLLDGDEIALDKLLVDVLFLLLCQLHLLCQ
jgi:hypothetical protein